MGLRGYVYANDGVTISVKAMHTQMSLMNIYSNNIANYAVPGYQRKQAVVTSFVEYLGPNAVDTATNTDIGRIRRTGLPMDLALASHGYFQRLNPSGTVELSRDGRFQLDKEGYLRSLEGKQILSANGTPIQFSIIPDDLEKSVKFVPNGEVQVFNRRTGKVTSMGRLGIADETGNLANTIDVKQGYVEDSNVMLQQEYMALIPMRREFEANRQMFIMQNDSLSRMIQELGRTS